MKISLKSFVVVYFLMFALVCLTKARLPPQKQKRNLSGAVIKIIEDVWSKTEITVNLLMATEDPRNLRQFDTINELVVGTGTFYAVALRIESLSSVRTPRRPKRCNVLVVETFLDFVKAYEAINPERFKFDGLFLIVFVKGRVAETATVFDLLWKIQIFNIDVAYEDDNGTAVIETYFPFNTAKCGETKPAVINTFKSGKFASDSNLLYPDKLKNLHECPVRVGTSNNSMPYIFADRLENGTYHLHGRDIELLKTLSNALNFKIDFVYVGEEGSLLDNGTASGAFKMLLERKADLIAADLWLRGNRLKYVDNTMPYINQVNFHEFSRIIFAKIIFNQHIAFVIPPGAELSSFEKFIKPLDKWTWMLLILFFAVAFLVIYVVGKLSPNVQDFIFGYGVRKPYMNILVAIFGGSQKVVPHRNFARSLLMMFLIFCLVMRTLYTGSLYRFLRAKVYHKEAQSIDEMIQRDYKFYTVSSILDLFKGQSRISPRLIELITMSDRLMIIAQIFF